MNNGNNLFMQTLLLCSALLAVTACGEPQYIVKGSDEYSVQEHLIKTQYCAHEYNAIETRKIQLKPKTEAHVQELILQAKDAHFVRLEANLSERLTQLQAQKDDEIIAKVKELLAIRDDPQLPMSQRKAAHKELETYKDRLMEQAALMEQIQKVAAEQALVATERYLADYQPPEEKLQVILAKAEDITELELEPLKQIYEKCAVEYLASKNLVYVEK